MRSLVRIDDTTNVAVSEEDNVTAYKSTIARGVMNAGKRFEKACTRASSGAIHANDIFATRPTMLMHAPRNNKAKAA